MDRPRIVEILFKEFVIKRRKHLPITTLITLLYFYIHRGLLKFLLEYFYQERVYSRYSFFVFKNFC